MTTKSTPTPAAPRPAQRTEVIELTGGWAIDSPYTVTSGGVALDIEHHPDGIEVVAPVGWRVHLPTHSGVRYVHLPEGWNALVPLATDAVVLENGENFVNLTCREPELPPASLELSSARARVRLFWRLTSGGSRSFRACTFDSWSALIDDHRRWMQEIAGVKPLVEVAPSWLVHCPLMIYLDIETVAGGQTIHTFDDVVALARRLEETSAPRDTTVYLTTWNDGGERRWPTYEPSALAGGADGLRAAADALHERGFRLMLHANVWGCSRTHPEYTSLSPHAVHTRAGHPLRWCEFHDQHVSEYHYINPGSRLFGELFWGSLGPLAEQLSLDALYLDQAGVLADDPAVDMLAATRRLIGLIRETRPSLVLGGQVLSSRLCDEIVFWQLWGTPWSGQGWGQPFRRRSSIVADLFRGFTRFCGHIHLPAAVPGRFLWHNAAFADDLGTVGAFLAAQEDNTYHGAVPSVRLGFAQHGIDPLSYEVIEQAARRAAPSAD